eukprot:UN08609
MEVLAKPFKNRFSSQERFIKTNLTCITRFVW